ncbi:MAG TPA: PD-(D/E)XK nuclease family protein, partial [Dongiaceae bacterium]|nr:PD-(D/E)XK nuclease family protein [Dongiaceae bacterium]
KSRARQQTLLQWQQWLQQFIRDSGWCQGRALESEEYQVRQRLLESITELNDLEEWLGPIPFERFRRELNDTARGLPFQPQTETAGIQILGVLEAAGVPFDALWLCECEAVNWPEALNPNPLLSRRLQRQLNMPGASPERELAYAARLLETFRTGAPAVVFSWGERDGETEHMLSSLLSSLPPVPASFYEECQYQQREHIQFTQMRNRIQSLPTDEQGPPLPQRHAVGGSGVLRAQSLCPFKAFAEFRLQLRARDDLTEGVKASDRGSLVHQVLELFWQEVKDWHQLQALLARENELDAVLNRILDQQLRLFRTTVVLEPEALYRLERERTFLLVKRWLLEADAARMPFQVVQVEKRKSLDIGGIELALSVDRVDTLQDGSQLIIDYKTGDRDAKAWQGERPEEPQLPLYAMLEPERTRGILFGVLQPASLSYKGLLDQSIPFSETAAKTIAASDDWNVQLQEWRRVLQQLAEQHAQGRAEVDPLNDMVCQYCHLSSVCRVRDAAHDAD